LNRPEQRWQIGVRLRSERECELPLERAIQPSGVGNRSIHDRLDASNEIRDRSRVRQGVRTGNGELGTAPTQWMIFAVARRVLRRKAFAAFA
jgi:hypothetical protein